jgi:hypothetical protein
LVVLGGHHLLSGADVVRHRMSEAQIGRDWPSTRSPKIRAGHATAHKERSGQPAFGSFEEVSSETVVSARPELHPFG